ncbi:MAG: hypothetical protein NZ898_11820 [Myxococcota bacterium]|nr:hypothetical protein [Myxococcota bacterium]MDW8362770.1 hypothetical protein [Myxococcales bacterium]
MGPVRVIVEALARDGVEAEILEALEGWTDLSTFWRESSDPSLLFRVASAAGLDPRWSIAAALDCAWAVAEYVGPDEPRPREALLAVRNWLEGRIGAEECRRHAEGAEAAARAYRDARKDVDASLRRSYRAAAYASYAAARTAALAADAGLTAELHYDEHYTFEDAWEGVRQRCGEECGRVARDVVEAAVSAAAAQVTHATGSYVAGGAAASEARAAAMRWAADIVRARIPVEHVVNAARARHGSV